MTCVAGPGESHRARRHLADRYRRAIDQTMPDGNLFVGWGALPYISEFSPSGTLLFNAQFPANASTYRAYRLPWPPPSYG